MSRMTSRFWPGTRRMALPVVRSELGDRGRRKIKLGVLKMLNLRCLLDI